MLSNWRLAVLLALWAGPLAIIGCVPPATQPTPRPPEQDTTSPPEPQQVVAAPPAEIEPAADAGPDLAEVERWIERVRTRDDIRSRIAAEWPAAPAAPDPSLSPDHAADPPASDAAPSPAPPDTPAAAAVDTTRPAEAPAPQSAPAAPPQPPVLGELRVYADRTAPAPARTGSSSFALNAPPEVAERPIALADLAERWLAEPADTSFRSQLDQRLLLVLAGRYDEARRPLEMVSAQQQLIAARFVESLIAIRDAHGGDPVDDADRVLAEIQELEQSLIPVSDLRISRLLLTRAVRDFGQYEPFAPAHFPTGRENEFVVYCEIANFVSRLRDDGRYESLFAERTAILTSAGDTVLELSNDHIVDECHARRRDCFIARLVRLPATLSPGEYVVKVTIVDKIGQKVAEQRTTFRILASS